MIKGFSSPSTVDDAYFGRGYYLTNSFQYASQYSPSKGSKLFVLCLAILGNPFPVTEKPQDDNKQRSGYNGKPCRPGYHSHFSVVGQEGPSKGFPVEGEVVEEGLRALEFVIFEESQLLPLFMVCYQDDPAQGGTGSESAISMQNRLCFIPFFFKPILSSSVAK